VQQGFNLLVEWGERAFYNQMQRCGSARAVVQGHCFQNDHIPLMVSYREAGPAYPTEVIDEFATITFVRDCGANNDAVIDCAASELPADFPNNLK